MMNTLERTKSRFAQANPGELIGGVVVVASGVYLIVAARGIHIVGTNLTGPRFFPYVVGAILVIAGVGVAISAAQGKKGESEGGEDVDASKSTDWKTLGFIAGLLLLYLLLVRPIGYLLMTMALFGGIAWILGARRWRPLVATSIMVPLVAYLFFTRVLGIYIPNGILEAVI